MSIRRALVVHPHLKLERNARRDPKGRLQEAIGLALAINLHVVDGIIAPMQAPRPSTFLGEGKVAELKSYIADNNIQLVIVDNKLTAVQQRNLETEWICKVIDRTALILEIFGDRARTAEGKLQVELAALNYQKGRLVRSWTHLERQRGGFGFLGGPGESQIETDRRLIRDRIAKIRRQLDTVVRTRELHRKKRRDVPYPLVALVGYTNAGKSTLFNTLTSAKVTAEDKLFATLDPTIRALRLPSGFTVMLSDTVGFVSDLPHDLVAAFRATLEEVLEADIILHVRDIAHAETRAQKQDVQEVLKELFEPQPLEEIHIIEVLNKIDLLPKEERRALSGGTRKVAVSAVTGEGVEELLSLLDKALADKFHTTIETTVNVSDGKALAWLHRHGKVVSKKLAGEKLRLTVQMSCEDHAKFIKMQKSTDRAKAG